MIEWLDHLTLVQEYFFNKNVFVWPGFETTFKPVTKSEERISQLSVISGKKVKGITRCGHIEKKDQGRTAQLIYLFSGPFVLSA